MILAFPTPPKTTCPVATRLAAKLYDQADSAHGWAADLIEAMAKEIERRIRLGYSVTEHEAAGWLKDARALATEMDR